MTVFGTPGDDVIFKDDTKVTLGSPVQETILTFGIETRTIHGGDGNDTITDPGSDTFLFGDAGNDTIIINASTGSGVTADGGDGSDTYRVVSGALQGPVTILDSGVIAAGVVDNVQVIGTPDADILTQTSTGFILNGTPINIGTGMETATVDGGGGSDQRIVEGTPPIPQVTIVTPSAGRDWFFANLMLDANNGDAATKKDKIDDANSNEFGYDIDFWR